MSYFTFSGTSRFDVKWSGVSDTGPDFYRAHSNPYFELIMVSDGPVHMETGGQRLVLNAGECLLLKPWEEHSGWHKSSSGGRFFWVQFHAEPSLRYYSSWNLLVSELKILHAYPEQLRTSSGSDGESLIVPQRFAPVRRFDLLQTFEQLIRVHEQPKGYFSFHLSILFSQLMLKIAEDALDQLNPESVFPSSFITYRKLLSLLHENYTSDCTAGFIELQLQRRYEYLCQIFSKYSGLTMRNYIQQLRVQHAKHLLLENQADVRHIAEQVGYADPLYFSKIFKKLEGIPPTDYRLRYASISSKNKTI
ncbi:helix-turn-helix domain-containing protein [Paenibacillus sp. NPDC056579]|uniref:AraC family transcriptional regulator n=1 Tax=Paenibacillus sp. NPDC056579 TaxID=3345871 RepID=UPI0036B98CE9